MTSSALQMAMSQAAARPSDDDAEQHACCDGSSDAEDQFGIAFPGDSDCVGDQTGLREHPRLEVYLLDDSNAPQLESVDTPWTIGYSGSASRRLKIAGLAVGLLAGAAFAAAVSAIAHGAHAHSGDGALEAGGRLNMRAFSGSLSAEALPALRRAAGVVTPDDVELEKAEAVAFLKAVEGEGKPKDERPKPLKVPPEASAAVLDAQRTLGIFTMKSSTEGSGKTSRGCAPVAAACGQGAKKCCGGSRCSKRHGGRCVLKLPAAVPQDLVNGSFNSASLKKETIEKFFDAAEAAGTETAPETSSSNNASLKKETVEKGGAAEAAGAETSPEIGSSNNASLKKETVEKGGAAEAAGAETAPQTGSSNSTSLKKEAVEKGGAAEAAGAETAPEASTTTELPPCAESGQNCLESGCCARPGHTCFRQNDWWASCNATCSKTSTWDLNLSRWVRAEAGGGWDCAALTAPSPRGPRPESPGGCALSGEQCASSRCCSHPGFRCFKKDRYWASCNATCSPRRKWDAHARAWADSDRDEWDCEELIPNGSVAAEDTPKSATTPLPQDEDDLVYMK